VFAKLMSKQNEMTQREQLAEQYPDADDDHPSRRGAPATDCALQAIRS
jgi:hypothetical protein